jgi:hypothetical protein
MNLNGFIFHSGAPEGKIWAYQKRIPFMYKLASDSVLTSDSSGINDIIFDEYRKDNIELRNARNIAKLIVMLYEETICKI